MEKCRKYMEILYEKWWQNCKIHFSENWDQRPSGKSWKKRIHHGENWEITQEKTLVLTGKILEFTNGNGEKI
jgi:hypothetical protein